MDDPAFPAIVKVVPVKDLICPSVRSVSDLRKLPRCTVEPARVKDWPMTWADEREVRSRRRLIDRVARGKREIVIMLGAKAIIKANIA